MSNATIATLVNVAVLTHRIHDTDGELLDEMLDREIDETEIRDALAAMIVARNEES